MGFSVTVYLALQEHTVKQVGLENQNFISVDIDITFVTDLWCQQAPTCINGGTCIHSGSHTQCICLPGYAGPQCNIGTVRIRG